MSLTWRRRRKLANGKDDPSAPFHVRGTIQVGGQTFDVDEHTTGLTDESLVKAYCKKLERDKAEEVLHGVAFVRRKITFHDAANEYLKVCSHDSDESRVVALTIAFDDKTLGEIDATNFAQFTRDVLPGRSPNTHERHRIVLAQIYKAAGLPFPAIPSYAKDITIPNWLEHAEADRLIACYPKHVIPIAQVAKDCGLRASENLLLEIGQCAPDAGPFGMFKLGTDQDRINKNGNARSVPWTPAVRDAVLPLMKDRARHERLFRNRYGEGYRDTRKKGGNPLDSSHTAALKDAGFIAKDHTGPQPFRWHDWRHHWATWALVDKEYGGFGWKERELMRYGGWKDYNSVSKYVDVIDRVSLEKFRAVHS